jgi:aspartate ammonia-lyase
VGWCLGYEDKIRIITFFNAKTQESPMAKKGVRKQTDSLGTLTIPKNVPYGIHTVRSLHNFSHNSLWSQDIIKSIITIKQACAIANNELGEISTKKKNAIVSACEKPFDPKNFPLSIYQAGSGTSTNMNVNEVLAHYASTTIPIHPNDDVNKGQSTNNVIPTAIRLTLLQKHEELLKQLTAVEKALAKKATEFKSVIKSARTHLQDAVPITLGQEFGAYATAIRKHIQRITFQKNFLTQLGIGGNAVGTGINTKKQFKQKIVSNIKKLTTLQVTVSKDSIESTQFLTDILCYHSAIHDTCVDLNKIANDLRLLASGPNTGFGEIELPAVEPGSSIMPGKINPSILEEQNMICHRIFGNQTTLTISCTSGNLDLNTHMPVIGNTCVESCDLLIAGLHDLHTKCLSRIKANKKKCESYVYNSAALATALNPHLGYDAVSALVKESLKTKKTIIELVTKKKLLTKKQVETILNPVNLTKPNR